MKAQARCCSRIATAFFSCDYKPSQMSSKDSTDDNPIVLEEKIDRKDTSSVEETDKVSSSVEIIDPDGELLLPSRRPIAEKKLPHNTRWLSPSQRRLAQVRLAEDAGEADEDSAEESYVALVFYDKFCRSCYRSLTYGVKLALKDPKVYIFSVMGCSQLLGLSFVNFFPT
ncbi:hypothetical protein EIP86_003791 [Pleurotus ostreatoroseus]|nr:hypothetical protein EIP86_003791 [Pleurotus ostreatoroseus]